MKSAHLTFHQSFPATPISWYAGARCYGWIREKTTGGQYKRPKSIAHPFMHQRRQWCLLSVHFQDIELRFAMPAELDHFIAVMSRNPLPSGHALFPGWAIGRPNQHWLSRLPKRTKPWKFRQAICKYLSENETVKSFRNFYRERPLSFEFDGIYDSYHQARASHLERLSSPQE